MAAGSSGGSAGAGGARVPPTMPVFVISVAAELSGMHPQTLRQYDRLGLVTPARTKGRGRRYSSRDVQRLRDIQRMSQDEGISLAGIQRILDLEGRLERLEAERDALNERLDEYERRRDRVFAASASGEVSPLRRGERPWAHGAAGPGGTAEGEQGAALIPWDPWEAFSLQAAAAAVRMRHDLMNRRLLEGGPAVRPAVPRIIDGVVEDAGEFGDFEDIDGAD